MQTEKSDTLRTLKTRNIFGLGRKPDDPLMITEEEPLKGVHRGDKVSNRGID